MILEIKQRGYEDGWQAAKIAKEEGRTCKGIMKDIYANDKEISKQFMKEFGIGREKAFAFALKYSTYFDRGVSDFVYENFSDQYA